MVKVTIIMWIASIVMYFIHIAVCSNMTSREIITARLLNEYPKRYYVSAFIWLLLLIASIVLSVITVIKW